jgi:hypothetical protein
MGQQASRATGIAPFQRNRVQSNRTPMATDHIRYDVLARDALRGVLRRVLTDDA